MTTTQRRYISRMKHVYLWPSQWGQLACDHLLHHAVATDVRVTFIVPRRDEHLFRSRAPTIAQWSEYPSVAAAVERLREQGRAVDFVFDDYLDAIRARMVREVTEEDALSVVYVTSSAESHKRDAEAFIGYAQRIVIEKPFSAFFCDVATDPSAKWEKSNTQVFAAEHYLFRPGVSLALSEPPETELKAFLKRHKGEPLTYRFVFEEAAGREDPNDRPGAFNDGALLDVAVVHGLGPVARILLPALDAEETVDLAKQITWTRVAPMQAKGVATLAETGVELHGELRLPDAPKVEIELRSVKGSNRYSRYFEFEAPKPEKHRCFYGVSLGTSGYTVEEVKGGRPVYVTRDGGVDSDTAGGRSGAANAQAAMLTGILADEPDDRLLPLRQACQILRLTHRAQGLAAFAERTPYQWASSPPMGEKLRWLAHDANLGESHADQGTWETAYELEGFGLLRYMLGLPDSPGGQSPGGCSKPLHRFFTYLGDEGEGNGDLTRAIEESFDAEVLSVPRDVGWARSSDVLSGGRNYTLDFLVRDIAKRVEVRLPAGESAVEALVTRLAEQRKATESNGEQGAPKLMVFNGVDRLSSKSWQQLIRVLAALPNRYRVVLLTNRSNRTAGIIVRTGKAMAHLSRDKGSECYPKDMLSGYPWLKRLTLRPPIKNQDELDTEIDTIARQNVTLKRQLRAYVRSVVHQWAKKRVGSSEGSIKARLLTLKRQLRAYVRSVVHQWAKKGVGSSEGSIEAHLLLHLQALDLPPSLTPNPTALLERIAQLIIAEVAPDDRAMLRDLALKDRISQDVIKVLHPRVYKLLQGAKPSPVPALFELRPEMVSDDTEVRRMFPRARRALLTTADAKLEALRDQMRRRLQILLWQEKCGLKGAEDDAHLLALLGASELESLPLHQPRFERLAVELVERLADPSEGGAALAVELVDLLVSGEGHETALGIWARVHLLSLSGALLFDAAGGNAAREHAGLLRLRTSFQVAHIACDLTKERARGEETRPWKKLVASAIRLVLAELFRSPHLDQVQSHNAVAATKKLRDVMINKDPGGHREWIEEAQQILKQASCPDTAFRDYVCRVQRLCECESYDKEVVEEIRKAFVRRG